MKEKCKKLTLSSPLFPDILRNIPSPPKELYFIGSLDEAMARKRLSVVGSRKVSAYGQQVTSNLVEEVAQHGVAIVSGLALGVDGIAHKAALRAHSPTIAVLAGGLDSIYPASHFQLARDIVAAGGALLSEYPEGSVVYPNNFIARNRLVSGLSDGLLITEAAAKSGTMHTAKFALDQGKTVMAVPGNITSEGSAGTNNLIKSGAIPVTNVDDILLALDITADKQERLIFGDSQEEVIILQLLSGGITDGALLLAQSGLDASTYSQTLTMLEIGGKIRPLGSGHWSIR